MFAAIAEEFYKTELKTVDFHHPPEAAMQINAWVSNITKGKISHLVSEGKLFICNNTINWNVTVSVCLS